MRKNRGQREAIRKLRKCLLGICISFGLSTAALLCIPFLGPSYASQLPTSYLITGLLFWLGVIGQAVFYLLAALQKKKYVSLLENDAYVEGPFGIIGLFRNSEAKIADIALAVSVLWLILAILCKWNGSWQVMLPVTAFYLSLQLHSLLNGRIYNILRTKTMKDKGDRKNDNNH